MHSRIVTCQDGFAGVGQLGFACRGGGGGEAVRPTVKGVHEARLSGHDCGRCPPTVSLACSIRRSGMKPYADPLQLCAPGAVQRVKCAPDHWTWDCTHSLVSFGLVKYCTCDREKVFLCSASLLVNVESELPAGRGETAHTPIASHPTSFLKGAH